MVIDVGRLWFGIALLVACQTRRDQTTVGATASSSISAATSTPVVRVATGGPSEALVTSPWVDTKAVFDTSLDAPNFQCAPKVFTSRDTIALRVEIPHGGWLSVEGPDSTFFTLSSPFFHEHYPFSPLVEVEALKQMLILRFRADIRMRPNVYGRDTLEPVFRVPGEYRFTIGENLATEYDEEDPNWHCSIRLAGEPR